MDQFVQLVLCRFRPIERSNFVAPYLRLKYERQRRNWTQTDVMFRSVEVLGREHMITQAAISALEIGRRAPTPEELEGLGKIFEIHPASVLLKSVSVTDPEEVAATVVER